MAVVDEKATTTREADVTSDVVIAITMSILTVQWLMYMNNNGTPANSMNALATSFKLR